MAQVECVALPRTVKLNIAKRCVNKVHTSYTPLFRLPYPQSITLNFRLPETH